jgi:hypothetical protein
MEMDATSAAGRPGEQCEYAFMIVSFVVMTLFTLWLVLWFIWACSTYKGPEFSVAIAAVSGLVPAPDRPVLDPEFNLTVRITVRSRLMRSCDKPCTTVQVSYHGFTLASASAPEVCRIRMHADDDRTVLTTVVARGTRVWLPGPCWTASRRTWDARRGSSTSRSPSRDTRSAPTTTNGWRCLAWQGRSGMTAAGLCAMCMGRGLVVAWCSRIK